MDVDSLPSGTLVLIDAGNSNLKYCLVERERLEELSRSAELSTSADDLAVIVGASFTGSVSNNELASFLPGNTPSASLDVLVRVLAGPDVLVLLASVAQAAVRAGLRRLQQQCSGQFREVRVQASLGRLTMSYDRVEALGVDRWLAMLAGSWRFESGFCVIDCGSAITADFVAADGVHQGGLIAPGYETILASLELADSLRSAIDHIKGSPPGTLAAFELAEGAPADPGLWLGRSSAACIALGVRRMAGDFVGGVVSQLEGCAPRPALLTTGGGWWQVADRVTVDYRYVERLVFEGLLISWISGVQAKPFSA